MFTLSRLSYDAHAVDLGRAKSRLKIDDGDQDDDVLFLIAAAQDIAETLTGQSFSLAIWRGRGSALPLCSGVLWIPSGPLHAVTSISYLPPGGGDRITLPAADYEIANHKHQYGIRFLNTVPAVEDSPNAWEVVYQAGREDVPPSLAQLVLQLTSYFYIADCGDTKEIPRDPGRYPYIIQSLLEQNRVEGHIV